MTNSLFNPVWPRWIADLHRLLGIRPQFILSGPIRDLFLILSITHILNGRAGAPI